VLHSKKEKGKKDFSVVVHLVKKTSMSSSLSLSFGIENRMKNELLQPTKDGWKRTQSWAFQIIACLKHLPAGQSHVIS
jgi:hypothetical protein